jgi:TPR repeat protein
MRRGRASRLARLVRLALPALLALSALSAARALAIGGGGGAGAQVANAAAAAALGEVAAAQALPFAGRAQAAAAHSAVSLEHVQRLLAEADAGLPEANYMLGLLALYGGADGVRVDLAAARRWFTAAASKGHADAATNVGLMVLHGVGEEQQGHKEHAAAGAEVQARNAGTAARWLLQAAESGSADAQWMLGRLYYDGLVGAAPAAGAPGAPRKLDLRSAAQWFSRAAAQGSPRGLFNLGILHEYGAGGQEQDLPRALALYRRAYADGAGDKEAGYYAAVLMLYGRGVPQDLKAAARIIRDCASAGIAPAMLQLAKLHTHGQGVERDYRLAQAWFGKAVEAPGAAPALREEAGKARDELKALLEAADKQMLDDIRKFKEL